MVRASKGRQSKKSFFQSHTKLSGTWPWQDFELGFTCAKIFLSALHLPGGFRPLLLDLEG